MLMYVKTGLTLKQISDLDVLNKFPALICSLASNSKINVDKQCY